MTTTHQEWLEMSTRERVDFIFSLDRAGIEKLVQRSGWTLEQLMTVNDPLSTVEGASNEFENASDRVISAALEWAYRDNPAAVQSHKTWFLPSPEIKRARPARTEYVYLMRCQGLYKIGVSVNPEQRRRKIQGSGAFDVELICTIQSNDMFALETELHQRFSGKRVRREWFALNKTDIAYVQSLGGIQ